MTTNISDVRDKWQPAPGSRLDVALGAAEEAAARSCEAWEEVAAARAERALVQQRLDAVQLGSDVQAVADDIGRAEALDLIIMRGQLELNRRRVALDAAASDADGVVDNLRWADKAVAVAIDRWGESHSDVTHAKRARQDVHMRYLATPSAGAAEVS